MYYKDTIAHASKTGHKRNPKRLLRAGMIVSLFESLYALVTPAVVDLFVLRRACDGIHSSPGHALSFVELAAFTLGKLFVWNEFWHVNFSFSYKTGRSI